jgi:hypothetical protein
MLNATHQHVSAPTLRQVQKGLVFGIPANNWASLHALDNFAEGKIVT